MSSTILIVEDHDGLRTALHDWLTAVLPDCCLLEATSGEEAVALTRDHAPDLVLMDINLPTMNGLEATRRITHTWPHTQVVVLTIHEDDDFRAGAQAAGAVGYVTKRNMYVELMPTLVRLLSSASVG
jgi:DNA-binding NarL/FixJ family response regulator